MASSSFKHDARLARAVFKVYAAEAGRRDYELWLDHYVKPILKELRRRGVIDGVEGLRV